MTVTGNSPPPDTDPSIVPGSDEDAIPPTTHDYAERYVPQGLLGAGGMGEVQLCSDRIVGREVALKIIREAKQHDSDAARRFAREARLQGRLEHPSIVPVYDIGLTADGRDYFTMKRVRGRTMAEIITALAEGQPEMTKEYSRRKLLTAFVNVCLAVELAHSRGVVHRDLKPSNIMLGDFGEVYVLDWGVAKVAGSEQAEAMVTDALLGDVSLTVTGEILGTPGYMSPEQVRGDIDVGARSDVYALGAILFELLTHSPLNPAQRGVERLNATVTGVEARPSVRFPERDVPPELESLCVRATALAAADRLGSAREVANEVERFLDGDRDMERRRQLADTHTSTADALAAQAYLPGGGVAKLQRALAEIGQALGLDPLHRRARRILVRLLASTPPEMPEEASAALDSSALATQSLGARVGVISYTIWLLAALPLGLWMGIQDRLLFGLFIAAQGAALAGTAWCMRARTVGGWPVVASIGGALLATFTINLAFGPLLLLPTVITATMGTMLLHPNRSTRPAVVLASCGMVVLPLVLMLLRVVEPFYKFEGGVMSMVPHMVRFTEAPTLIALLLGSLATIVTLAVAVTRIRNDVTDAERRLQLHAWQLRQLVPEESSSS